MRRWPPLDPPMSPSLSALAPSRVAFAWVHRIPLTMSATASGKERPAPCRKSSATTTMPEAARALSQ